MWPTSNTQISQTTLPTFPHWDDEKEDKGNARLHGHSLRSSPQKKAEGFNSLSQGSLFVWVAMGLPNVQIIILSGYHFVAPIHSKVIWSPQRFWSLYIFHIMTSHHITSIKIPGWHIQEAARFFKACMASIAALAGSVATAWRATMVVNLGHSEFQASEFVSLKGRRNRLPKKSAFFFKGLRNGSYKYIHIYRVHTVSWEWLRFHIQPVQGPKNPPKLGAEKRHFQQGVEAHLSSPLLQFRQGFPVVLVCSYSSQSMKSSWT